MQVRDFRLPDVGEGLTEAEVVRWLVAVGDTVEINQMLVEVETAKALVELPSPYAGTVRALHAAPGQIVPVGSPLIGIEAEGAVDTSTAPTPTPEGTREAVLVGYGVMEAGTRRRRLRRDGASAAAPAVPTAPASTPTTAPMVRALAAPPVRKLARDMGIDLSSVTGTGVRGEVTRDDLARIRPTATAAPPTVLAGERIEVRGVQRAMASAMVASAFTSPHVTVWMDVDVTRSVELVRVMRDHPSFADSRPTMLTVVASAVVHGVRRHPRVNARWEDRSDGGADIVVADRINLGFAADTPRGLMVPNVKDAHALSLPALSARLSQLTESARAGRLAPSDLTGGTLTITNVGVFGIDGGTPILNPGESAILAMGRVSERPWVVDGELAVRSVMTLALSFDHRVVDGSLGSRFLAEVARVLGDPAPALLLG